ncbi:MAG: threonylcarbamoyl-AMP synthase [Clostridiales bacterium]|jgi:L-threonylcarbamoyladenylate synthase|nr:threonylcarbamoyl-AMP synthase [Clostridiales bacterium]
MLRNSVNTLVLKYNGENDVIAKAASVLKKGGLVAFPTETVYGLGANGLDPDAASKIYAAKGRPVDNPLILHIASFGDLESVVSEIPEKAEKLAQAFWPGPLTLVLKKHSRVPDAVTCGLPAAAVRFPKNPVAAKLIRAAGFPLAAPSANSSGKPSPTKASHVAFDLSGKIDMIVDGGTCSLGIESTIIDASKNVLRLLRPGAVTLEDIEREVGRIEAGASVETAGFETAPEAPGMKYKHYSPLASVTVVSGDQKKTVAEIVKRVKLSGKKTGVLTTDATARFYETTPTLVMSLGSGANDAAKNLFATLRRLDFYGVEEVYAEALEETGIGLAVMNRLKKAAANNIVYV